MATANTPQETPVIETPAEEGLEQPKTTGKIVKLVKGSDVIYPPQEIVSLFESDGWKKENTK